MTPVETQLDLARAMIESLADGEPARVEGLVHPEAELHDAWAVGAGMYRGLPGMRQLYADFSSAWGEFSFALVELEPTADGRVFVTARQRARRRGNGRTSERTMYFVLAFRDHKVVSLDGWHLRSVARGAAGLDD